MPASMTTFTGRRLNLLKLRVEDICIEDIAHHLATLNRFVGALRRPVSIAQHSVYVARLVQGTGWEKEALFHDAAEAYLGDVSKWLKEMPEMALYREAEDRAMSVICEALGLRYDMNRYIKWADDLMVRFEALMEANNSDMFTRTTHPKPTPEEIEKVGEWAPWTWQASERAFLDHARLLGYKVAVRPGLIRHLR